MKQTLVKIKTEDNIELTGIIYEPEIKSNKVIVHVHGLAGNFYENSFIDYQAKIYTNNGYSYFVFNNRGNGYITELIIKEDSKKLDYINGGATFELFEDSYLDINSAVNYVLNLGYEDIILQGHSYGCNKVVYYYFKNKLKDIKSIILLAPCDVNKEFKMFIGNEYNEYIKKCEIAIAENFGEKIIENKLFPPMGFSANTFLTDFIASSRGNIFRYREKEYLSDDLKSIDIPVLVQIGEIDSNVLVVDKEDINFYLKNNINNLEIKYILDSNHGYINHEEEMSNNCIDFLNNI